MSLLQLQAHSQDFHGQARLAVLQQSYLYLHLVPVTEAFAVHLKRDIKVLARVL